MDIKEILTKLEKNEISIEEAEKELEIISMKI